jgi:hypothetical protein
MLYQSQGGTSELRTCSRNRHRSGGGRYSATTSRFAAHSLMASRGCEVPHLRCSPAFLKRAYVVRYADGRWPERMVHAVRESRRVVPPLLPLLPRRSRKLMPKAPGLIGAATRVSRLAMAAWKRYRFGRAGSPTRATVSPPKAGRGTECARPEFSVRCHARCPRRGSINC